MAGGDAKLKKDRKDKKDKKDKKGKKDKKDKKDEKDGGVGAESKAVEDVRVDDVDASPSKHTRSDPVGAHSDVTGDEEKETEGSKGSSAGVSLKVFQKKGSEPKKGKKKKSKKDKAEDGGVSGGGGGGGDGADGGDDSDKGTETSGKRGKRKHEDISGGGDEDETSRTVYVEGIPYDADEKVVEEFFGECGEISSVRMPRWQDSGKPRGYAHVEFKTSSGAGNALGLDHEHMGSRFVRVFIAAPRSDTAVARTNPGKRPRGCKTLFVKNLPYEVDEEGVRASFAVYGPVKDVRLARWNHTGRVKGIGYVEFDDGQSAEAAMRAENVKVRGRFVVLDYDTGAPKASFKTSTGRSWHKHARTLR